MKELIEQKTEATQVIGHRCWHFANQRYAIVLSSPKMEGEKGKGLSGEILVSWVDNGIAVLTLIPSSLCRYTPLK